MIWWKSFCVVMSFLLFYFRSLDGWRVSYCWMDDVFCGWERHLTVSFESIITERCIISDVSIRVAPYRVLSNSLYTYHSEKNPRNSEIMKNWFLCAHNNHPYTEGSFLTRHQKMDFLSPHEDRNSTFWDACQNLKGN